MKRVAEVALSPAASRVLLGGLFRFVLGQVQIWGAVASAIMLARTGVSRPTLTLTALTMASTGLSLFLYRVLPRWKSR